MRRGMITRSSLGGWKGESLIIVVKPSTSAHSAGVGVKRWARPKCQVDVCTRLNDPQVSPKCDVTRELSLCTASEITRDREQQNNQ